MKKMANLSSEGLTASEIDVIRLRARKAIGELSPAGSPRSQAELNGALLSSRTAASRSLPPYYLVYFLLVDLLGFYHMGEWEKVAWSVPVRLGEKLYLIEHRKFGLGIFAPNLEAGATQSGFPSADAEADAVQIARLIRSGVSAAEPYFESRARSAVATENINVVNKNQALFERYVYFNDRARSLSDEAEARKEEKIIEEGSTPSGGWWKSVTYPSYKLRLESEWNAQAAIEAFFSWTEHIFIHLAILRGVLRTGEDVAKLADADWKAKFKAALDIGDAESKAFYDSLLDLRAQIRNFMAHGAFGKHGEAFSFHSGAGAVPILLSQQKAHRFSMTGKPDFNENQALEEISRFIAHLWSGPRAPAQIYIESGLPGVLTFACDGTYADVMRSEAKMNRFVDRMSGEADRAANMDW
nr:hypothetical protein [Paraburkholderia caribensis]